MGRSYYPNYRHSAMIQGDNLKWTPDEKKRTPMKKRLALFLMAITLTLFSASVLSQTLNEAASKAAKQHNAKVLSAQTVNEGNKQVHVIKLLTKDGVVKTVRVTVKGR